ncbi:MAG: DegV family protein [Lachnospiraceae bacterium]|nr:DegV family protein [Lachnospiraceae bacterium]
MAEYKIIADSSCELPDIYRNDERFALVPFRMEVDGVPYRDTKNLNIRGFLDSIAKSKTCPKSACPSPDLFMKQFSGDVKRIYVITISGKLSGCYNSAMLAKSLYEEEHDDKQITVIDSMSASGGECLIALKAMELEEAGLVYDEIVCRLNHYRDHISTYFVLDNIDTLRKNGRLSAIRALAANALNVKPLLAGKMGDIIQLDKAIGLKKAWDCMVKRISRDVKNLSDMKNRTLIITHCNNLKGAQKVRDMLRTCTDFKEYIIMNTSGLSSLYANEGGIIVVY